MKTKEFWKEMVPLKADVLQDCRKAICFEFKEGMGWHKREFVWLPKSQVEQREFGIWYAPRWLLKAKGLTA